MQKRHIVTPGYNTAANPADLIGSNEIVGISKNIKSLPLCIRAGEVLDSDGHGAINSSALAIALRYGKHAEFPRRPLALDTAKYRKTASRPVHAFR